MDRLDSGRGDWRTNGGAPKDGGGSGDGLHIRPFQSVCALPRCIMCRGVFGPYKKSLDPWQRDDVRDFMRSFWRTTMSWLRQVRGRNDTAPPRQGCMPSQQHLWAMQAHVTVPQMKDMKGYLPSRNDLLLTMRSESHLLPLNPGHRAAARPITSRRATCGTSHLGTVRGSLNRQGVALYSDPLGQLPMPSMLELASHPHRLTLTALLALANHPHRLTLTALGE